VNRTRRRLTTSFLQGALVGATDCCFAVHNASPGAGSTTISVREFGARGDGHSFDRPAISSALKASNRVLFPRGDYNLGELSHGETVFNFHPAQPNAALLTEGRVRLVAHTTDRSIPKIFEISGARNLEVGDFEITDTGGDNSHSWRGAIGFLINAERHSSSNLAFGALSGYGLVSMLTVTGKGSHRARGVRIRRVECHNCFYGVNCQDNGDDVEIGRIVAVRCRRSYFVYGVKNHKVVIESRDGRTASSDVLIKRYKFDTSHIRVLYHARDSGIVAPNGLVAMEHQPEISTGPGTISDIAIELHIDAPSSTAFPVVLRSYESDGTPELGTTANRWSEISLSGVVRTAAPVAVYSTVKQLKKGRLYLQLPPGTRIDHNVKDSFDLST
jgi:hypothetical protein